MRKRVKAVFALGILLVLLGGCKRPVAVVTVEGETVYEQQATLYLALTLKAYEEQAGKEIWNMRIGGVDAFDAACEAAMESMIRNKTVLIIAHRMRTVAGADKIVVLENGKTVQQGSPAELMEQDGLYRHMVRIQQESADWTL